LASRLISQEKSGRGKLPYLKRPPERTSATSEVLVVFVAKSGKQFRQFILSIPNEEWKTKSQGIPGNTAEQAVS
jgi:hypothetical protein